MISRLRTFGGACHSVGVINTLLYIWKTKAVNKICSTKPKLGGYRTGTLSSKQLQHPVVRYNSSDISVFSQIFIAKEYQLTQNDRPCHPHGLVRLHLNRRDVNEIHRRRCHKRALEDVRFRHNRLQPG